MPLCFLLSCRENIKVQRLSVEEGKKFEKFNFKKIWTLDLYGGWCLALPQGVVCSELLDRSYKESQLKLYDYSGRLIKERKLIHGDVPTEIRVWNFPSVWVSSSGGILTEDNDYLKAFDPETLEIETIAKLSNVIEGYGSKYTLGRLTHTSLEEKGNRTVTSFESSGFFEDLTYYLVTYSGVFGNLSVIATEKKQNRWVGQRVRKAKRKAGWKAMSIIIIC